MSRFYGSIRGSAQSPATRRGTPASGIDTHTRGWNVGIGVLGSAHADDDMFTAYVTAGSSGADGYGREVFSVVYQPGGVKVVTIADAFGGGSFVVDGFNVLAVENA